MTPDQGTDRVGGFPKVVSVADADGIQMLARTSCCTCRACFLGTVTENSHKDFVLGHARLLLSPGRLLFQFLYLHITGPPKSPTSK